MMFQKAQNTPLTLMSLMGQKPRLVLGESLPRSTSPVLTVGSFPSSLTLIFLGPGVNVGVWFTEDCQVTLTPDLWRRGAK